jgi:hypothetical protein
MTLQSQLSPGIIANMNLLSVDSVIHLILGDDFPGLCPYKEFMLPLQDTRKETEQSTISRFRLQHTSTFAAQRL